MFFYPPNFRTRLCPRVKKSVPIQVSEHLYNRIVLIAALWLQMIVAVEGQLSQAKDAFQTAKSRIEALQLEAREAKKQASQAAEHITDLKGQLSASDHHLSGVAESVPVAEVEEKIKAVLRGGLATPS